jgi:hypothetical protein
MTIVQVSTPGPQGPAGPTGATGGAGANGNTVWPTTGAPSVSVGVNGDFANDSTNSVMYGPKANGAWPSGVSYKGSNGAQGAQGVPGAAAKWQTGTTYTGLVATRGKSMTSVNTAALQHMSRSVHVARTGIINIGVAFANWYRSVGAERNTGSDATIEAAIEYPLGGEIYPLTFNGASSGVVKDYSTLLSDLLPITIPTGAQFAVREYRVCAAGGGTIFANTIQIDTIDGDCYQYGSAVENIVGNTGTFTRPAPYFISPSPFSARRHRHHMPCSATAASKVIVIRPTAICTSASSNGLLVQSGHSPILGLVAIRSKTTFDRRTIRQVRSARHLPNVLH